MNSSSIVSLKRELPTSAAAGVRLEEADVDGSVHDILRRRPTVPFPPTPKLVGFVVVTSTSSPNSLSSSTACVVGSEAYSSFDVVTLISTLPYID